jgi:hypothetical protein
MAFVEQIARRFLSQSKNGANSLQILSHSRMIARYCPPHFAVNSTKQQMDYAGLDDARFHTALTAPKDVALPVAVTPTAT